MGSHSWINEKKFVEGQEGDNITAFDGTEASNVNDTKTEAQTFRYRS